MRVKFFASSLIFAASRAIDLVSDYDPLIFTQAQVDASAEWTADGKHPKTYQRPDDNCCVIYHGKDFTKPADQPVCWPRGFGKKGVEKDFQK